MKFQALKFLAVIAAVLSISQPAAAGECDSKEALFKGAAEARVPLNYEQTVTASSEGISFAGTSVAGFEQVPADALREGADAGFIYLDAPQSGIPAGTYKLVAQAGDVHEGEYEGKVSLVARDGKVVAQLPATMNTWSMEVPRPLPFERTTMEAQIRTAPPKGDPQASRIIIIIHCPNGTTIVIIFGW